MDSKGKILIWRDYRGDVSLSSAERFMSLVLKNEELETKPIFEDEGVSYVSIKHNDLILMAVTKKNADASMILLFLYTLIKVLIAYFEVLEEESIRDNFVIIYELLDEMMDFGYPQATDAKILQEFITQEFYKLDKSEHDIRPAPALSTMVPWRSDTIKYPTNEVFLDVVESVNTLVASNGSVLQSEVTGKILINSRLSGMPNLKLGLNDRVQLGGRTRERREDAGNTNAIEMEDVTFHQCVSLNSYEKDGSITFIPPDGQFELLSYRLSRSITKPVFWVEAVVDKHDHSRIEYLVKVRSQFRSSCTANNVALLIPVPPDVDSPKFRSNRGNVEYAPSKNAIIWFIPKFEGGREFLMRAHFGLPSTSSEEKEETKRPIVLKFEIPYFTLSGIQVRYLRIVERGGYKALPWVKYLTRSGDYQFRIF